MMKPGTEKFDRLYTASHRLIAAFLFLYALSSAFSQTQIAVVTEVVLFGILTPCVAYLYFALGRSEYEAPIPFVVIILTLAATTVTWGYYRLLKDVVAVPVLPPLVGIAISSLLIFINSNSSNNN
jgi:hypothetical protein